MKGKIEVRRSPLHGRGVFATEPIRKGERIGQFIGERTVRNGRYVCWFEYDDGWRGYRGRGRLRFLNHADRPNSEFDGRDLFAQRLIRKGDEVTIHYGDDYEW